jgi:argininosuccinate lyase
VAGFLTTLKGLPLAYNRDLQEDKEPLFDAVDQVSLALGALAGMIATATFDTARMAAAASAPTMAATDLAEWLVARGMPFREAHAVVGVLVRASLEPGAPPLADLVAADGRLGAEAAALVAPGVAVRRRTTPGGGGPEAVAVQLQRFVRRLDADRARLG